MVKKQKLAVLALAAAFALIAALPASAADREDHSPRGARMRTAAAPISSSVKVYGGDSEHRVQVLQPRGPQTPSRFTVKSSCTWTCGDWVVTCSGSSTSCEDESYCSINGEVVAICI